MNFTDPKGNLYSAEGHNAIKIDINMCFRSKFQRAVALHQKEKFEQAAKSYAEAIQFGKILQETGHLPADMPKIYFDTGLVEIELSFCERSRRRQATRILRKSHLKF